jgi:hypothetical protein
MLGQWPNKRGIAVRSNRGVRPPIDASSAFRLFV